MEMEELKKALIEKIKETSDEGLLQEVESLLNRQMEIRKLENFVVESRIETLEDDEFLSHDEAVERTTSSLKNRRGPFKS